MAGASEQAIAQWASFFAETGLKVSKTFGDLVGASLFALFMFISRMWYGTANKKPKITNTIFIFSIGLALCYILTVIQPSAVLSLIFIALCGFFVGILWPGIYSIGGGIFESGGTVMFSNARLRGRRWVFFRSATSWFRSRLFKHKTWNTLCNYIPVATHNRNGIVNKINKGEERWNYLKLY
jgi:MFS family permease